MTWEQALLFWIGTYVYEFLGYRNNKITSPGVGLNPGICIKLLWVSHSSSLNQFSPVKKENNASVQSSVVSDSLQPHGLQHISLPCPSPTPRVSSNSCPFSWWCHPTISSSVVPFSFHIHSFPASGSFPMSQFFSSGGQSIGVSASASVLPMYIQDWFPLGLTGWIPLQSMELWGVFNTTVWKHQFFGAQFLYGPTLTSIHDYWKNHSFD